MFLGGRFAWFSSSSCSRPRSSKKLRGSLLSMYLRDTVSRSFQKAFASTGSATGGSHRPVGHCPWGEQQVQGEPHRAATLLPSPGTAVARRGDMSPKEGTLSSWLIQSARRGEVRSGRAHMAKGQAGAEVKGSSEPQRHQTWLLLPQHSEPRLHGCVGSEVTWKGQADSGGVGVRLQSPWACPPGPVSTFYPGSGTHRLPQFTEVIQCQTLTRNTV